MNINYKLVNLTLLSIIIFLFIQTLDVWFKVVHFIYELCLPFFISFVLSYVIYPFFNFFNKYFNKTISFILVLCVFLGGLLIFFSQIIPILISELIPTLEHLIFFIKDISIKYNINLDKINVLLFKFYEMFLNNVNTKEIVSASFNVVWIFMISLFSFFYFLFGIDKIKEKIKEKTNNKTFEYLKGLNSELLNYLSSFRNIIIITFFEYMIAFFIVGHSNFLLLAFIASFSNLIPCFGAFFTYLIAIISAFSISKKLLIKTLIVCLILSIIDNYIINPIMFGKKNNIHPLLVFVSIVVGTKVFGMWGAFISLPVIIIIIYSIKFWKKPI